MSLVIHRPETERCSHYGKCELPAQFDARLFDETTAVTPLPSPAALNAGDDRMWPSGL